MRVRIVHPELSFMPAVCAGMEVNVERRASLGSAGLAHVVTDGRFVGSWLYRDSFEVVEPHNEQEGRPPLVYVAGRYRGPTHDRIAMYINAAKYMGWLAREMGAYPVIPHTNTGHWELLETPSDVPREQINSDYYLQGTEEMLLRCDAVLMVPGWRASEGANSEYEAAEKAGIPVFENEDDLRQWIDDEWFGEGYE